MQLTHAEENHVKAIHHLTTDPEADVSTNALAEWLCTKPASVSDMLRRLATKSLVHYVKYRGVRLTETGERIALQVIRKHRLWETFLVEKLGFNWDEVHEVAEELEHIQSPLLIERLDQFLGHPAFDPHGDPIPDARGIVQTPARRLLYEMSPGAQVQVVGVRETTPLFLQYLDKVGIQIGSQLELLHKEDFDGSAEIRIETQLPLRVSRQVTENIYVTE